MSTQISSDTVNSEAVILARVLGNRRGKLSVAVARHLLEAGFSEEDEDRMNYLARGNQEGFISAAEREELHAYARAGTVLSILKSKARRVLGVKPKKR